MPRVRRQKASGRARRVCGALGCGRVIAKGEEYFTWSFRYGGRQVRCLDHPPRASDLTQSRMGEVYTAIENAQEQLAGDIESLADVKAAIEGVADAAREVVEGYREAAEHFGGQGQNAERADELEGWVDELDGFEPDEPEEQFDEDQAQEEAEEEVATEMIDEMDLETVRSSEKDDPLEGLDHKEIVQQYGDESAFTARVEDRVQQLREAWMEEHGDDMTEAIDNAKTEADDLLGQCPL